MCRSCSTTGASRRRRPPSIPSAKDWAYEAGVRAVASHLERTGFPATASRNPDWPGIIDLAPALVDLPPVSVIIPTGGTRRAVAGIDTLLAEQAVATLAAVTPTTRPTASRSWPCSTANADDDLGPTGSTWLPGPSRFLAVRDHRPFNFAMACNLGAVRASGEVLVFLNDDTEIAQPEWLQRLVMYATRPDIGAVGAKLLYGDGRIQHAGTWSRHGNPHHRYVGYRARPPRLSRLAGHGPELPVGDGGVPGRRADEVRRGRRLRHPCSRSPTTMSTSA